MELPPLPAWAKTLQRRIRQRGLDFFILYGPGVRDLHPLGARRFGTMGEFLSEVMLGDRSAIVTYDRGAGIGFTDRDVENDFKSVLKAYDRVGGTNLAQAQPRDPDRALQLIETYLRYQLTEKPRFSAAVIIDQDALTREKKRLIEESSGGLLTFMTSDVGLDQVAGHDAAKALLRETAQALARGRLDVVPMGYLICGPVGTGKSFIVRCFAREIGIPVVELLNFRSKWQGQTEANVERILGLLDAIGPVAVVVGQAEAALGTRESGREDSGVSERVFASLAAFMGDTRRRGKVIWFLMTSRP